MREGAFSFPQSEIDEVATLVLDAARARNGWRVIREATVIHRIRRRVKTVAEKYGTPELDSNHRPFAPEEDQPSLLGSWFRIVFLALQQFRESAFAQSGTLLVGLFRL